MLHNTGDKGVTMCGIAQEIVMDNSAYTRPWHVTLKPATAATKVSHYNHNGDSFFHLFDILDWIYTH